MQTLSDLNLDGKRVLIRADLNVPLDDSLKITDAHRIKQFLPTLNEVLSQGGRAIVMSHLGRPGGKPAKKYSLKPVAEYLEENLDTPVKFASDCIGPEVESAVEALQPKVTLLIENLRFHAGEEENDAEFSEKLARLGDVYVSDAFGTAHRAHASMYGVAERIPERCIGLLMQRELEFFEKALEKPERPLCVVLGGAKVSSKLGALVNVSDKADKIVIGGAMANTFLAAQGLQMGRSLYEKELMPQALEIVGKLARKQCHLHLPVDLVVAPSLKSKGLSRAVPAEEVPADMMALDIGPATRILFSEVVQNAGTIVWNGPMGAFEEEEFADGTESMTEALASAHGLTLVGGGDTDAAIHKMELEHKFDYISTGGGAFLELLEGKELPGIAVLKGS